MSKQKHGPFTLWLLRQEARTDLVGQLAEEVMDQGDWPEEDSLLACRVFLARDSASPQAMLALNLAHLEWEKSKHLPEVNTLVPCFLKHGVN